MPKIPFDWRRIALIAGVLFLILLLVDFNSRLENLNRLNNQVIIVRAEANNAELTQVMLQTQVAYASLDQTVEENARKENRMKKEGDKVFVVIGVQGELIIATPTPTPFPTPKPNWQLWQDLFFSEE